MAQDYLHDKWRRMTCTRRVDAGTTGLIDRARHFRKLYGGGWRQAGFLAAAGLYALHHHRPRLVEDHERAHDLALGFSCTIEGMLDNTLPELRVCGLNGCTLCVLLLCAHDDSKIALSYYANLSLHNTVMQWYHTNLMPSLLQGSQNLGLM